MAKHPVPAAELAEAAQDQVRSISFTQLNDGSWQMAFSWRPRDFTTNEFAVIPKELKGDLTVSKTLTVQQVTNNVDGLVTNLCLPDMVAILEAAFPSVPE